MSEAIPPDYDPLFSQIIPVIEAARGEVQRSVNTAMVQTYWNIGRLIVEHEQGGEHRAAYGKAQLDGLSRKLIERFGKGFSARNLRNMRGFHLAFPIWQTVCAKLSWSHYRLLSCVENEQARLWYMQEADSHSWSVRALDRQISVLYYERLLSSQDKQPVASEAKDKTTPLSDDPRDFLRDPYILDFLNLESGVVCF